MKKFILCMAVLFCGLMVSFPAAAVSQPPDFETMFNEHGAIILVIDPVTKDILFANEAAAHFYGYTKKKLQTMKITQINTLPAEEATQKMQQATSANQDYFLVTHRLANNDIRTVEVYSYPVQYGEKAALFLIIHDVTDQDQVQLQQKNTKLIKTIFFAGSAFIVVLLMFIVLLLKSRQKIKSANHQIENFNLLTQTFMDAENNLTYLKDENFKYVLVNRALENFYEKSSKEIIGNDDFALNTQEYAQKIRQTDLKVLRKMEMITEELHWKGVIHMITKFPVKMPNGSYGVGATIRDVTHERERERFREKVHVRNSILQDMLSLNFQNQQEQLDYTLHKALNLTDSKYGYIYYYNEETREFTLNSWTNSVMAECAVRDPQTKYQLEKTGIWGEVVRQRKPILINDFQAPNPLKKGYPDGHVSLSRFMSVPILIDDKIVAVVGLGNKQTDYDDSDIINVTILISGAWQAIQRKDAQEKLSKERQKYFQTLISIGDGVLSVDKNGQVEMLNKVAQRMTGWSNEEALGRDYREVFLLSHALPGHSIEDPIEGTFRTGEVQEMANHAVLTSRDGTRYCLEDSAAPVFNENGSMDGVVLVFRDVSEKMVQQEKIEYLSFHDVLTGLYNRRFFEEELQRIDTERNFPISIVLADVNSLKLTNDVFGHTCGDALLKTLAAVFQRNCRAGDIVARWGGDEFVMLLPKTSCPEAEKLIKRLKEDFSAQRVKAIQCSVSVGTDCKADSSQELLDVLDNAEKNMYSQKTLERETIKEAEILSIMESLQRSNPWEAQHSRNVSQLCEQFGYALNMSKVDLRTLKDAGYLHDIGKVVLKPELLRRLSELTEEERAEVCKHPIVGFRILNFSDKTLHLADIVLAHHEHWDGSGYPKGLKGEEIPQLTRMISLVENYERILNSTEGTGEIRKARALRWVRDGSGTLFDPTLAEQFINFLNSDAEEGD